MLLHPKLWAHGLISAFITGATSSITAAIIKPEAFNLGAGFHDMLKLAAVAGIVGAAAYLKNSPLPEIRDDIEASSYRGQAMAAQPNRTEPPAAAQTSSPAAPPSTGNPS